MGGIDISATVWGGYKHRTPNGATFADTQLVSGLPCSQCLAGVEKHNNIQDKTVSDRDQ